MTRLQTRVDALESTAAAANVCACPLTIQVTDYRLGIADDGGAVAESELCEHCGKRRAIIRIVITGDTVETAL